MSRELLLLREGEADDNAMKTFIGKIASSADRHVSVTGRKLERSSLRPERSADLVRLLETASEASDFNIPILITADADQNCAVQLAAHVRSIAATVLGNRTHGVAIAEVKLESWFLVCLDALSGKAGLAQGLAAVPDPGRGGDAAVEAALARNVHGSRRVETYSTEHALRFAKALDIDLCRQRSKSFDKFVREVQRLVAAPSPPEAGSVRAHGV